MNSIVIGPILTGSAGHEDTGARHKWHSQKHYNLLEKVNEKLKFLLIFILNAYPISYSGK
jgi:hypothetical protein